MTARRFLLYAPQDGDNLTSELGKNDYSYWFVMRYFEPVLRQLGTVEVAPELGTLLVEPVQAGDTRLVFMPPQRIPLDVATVSLPVFAWEYSSIPLEPWADEPRNDWRVALRAAPAAVTHSRFAARAVADAMGAEYPVAVLPAPVWDRYAGLADRPVPASWSLDISGVVLDSHEVSLRESHGTSVPPLEHQDHHLQLDGVVYTTVVNPLDGRKVWDDTVSAFVWAHRDNPRATLIMKLVHYDARIATTFVWELVRRLAPFQCRIVVIHGFLEAPDYERLIEGTSFVVNTSRGEGQCLPLMEFMSAGVPAIAPDHTAMAEYVNDRNAFVVSWSRSWTHWPHDPRRFLRCFTFPVEWESVHDAFVASHQVASLDPQRYALMRKAASASLGEFCSAETVRSGMAGFLDRLDERA